jgi:6-pyruvoyltetrahydropterin/6-carboxytetrahydropterin synthase
MATFEIKKSFHFYAAHRNEDHPTCHPCFNIHGHTFHLDCYLGFDSQDDAGVTKLFSEIERAILPVIAPFDHALILNRTDSLYEVLKDKGIKLCILDYPSSAENLAKTFFDRISSAVPMDLLRVDFRETTSSVVTYAGGQPSSKHHRVQTSELASV